VHRGFFSRFLRFFFKQLYHGFAWSYDFVAAAVSLGMWKSWVQSVLPYLEGPKILEIGHGPGHLQVALLKKGLFPIGLDESRHMGLLAFKRVKRLGVIPSVINGYAQLMPFKDASFHQVVSTFPSEFITDRDSLAEISRVLIPGGELLVLPVAWITGRRWYHRLAAWLFRITGQAPDWTELQKASQEFSFPFLRAGYRVELELVRQNASSLLLIHAFKPV
jgi:ubiquinone/menaquinone biosynthesis C-methylase UbiE